MSTVETTSDSGHAQARQMPGWLAILLLTVATLIAYANSFFGVFLFDDISNIVNNPALQNADLLAERFSSSGRPMLYLSLAINYRWGGLSPFGYHLFNLAVHLTAGLALFGCIRRTLKLDGIPAVFQRRAVEIAFTSALLWLVHPLQTGAVTYIVQRCESMMGMFFLLTLYCVIRGAAAHRGWPWYAAALLFAIGGIWSKEVMVAAVAVIPLYDRIFLSRSWREVAVRRGWVYGIVLLLAAWWFVPALLPRETTRPVSAGFQYSAVTPSEYLNSQPGVILHYLRLTFWPDRLCLDYWWPVARTWDAIVWPGLAIVGLLALVALGLWRRPRLGFLGAAFFLILAPTSSIMPIADLAFEHRMYLPLAAVILPAVLAVTAIVPHVFKKPRTRTLVVGALITYLALALTTRTIERNGDYRSAIRMWDRVIAVAPHNPRGYASCAWARRDDPEAAIPFCKEAIALRPEYPYAWTLLGQLYARQDEPEEAMACYRHALTVDPAWTMARYRLSQLLTDQGEYSEAIEQLRVTIAAHPLFIDDARARLAWLLATCPDPLLRDGDEALRLALQLQKPSESRRGSLLQRVLRNVCAVIVWQGAAPDHPNVFDVLAAAYAEAGRFPEAVENARRALDAAEAAGLSRRARGITERLRLYEQNLPYRNDSVGEGRQDEKEDSSDGDC